MNPDIYPINPLRNHSSMILCLMVSSLVSFTGFISAQECSKTESLGKLKSSMEQMYQAKAEFRKDYSHLLSDSGQELEERIMRAQIPEVKSLTILCIKERIFREEDAGSLIKYILCYASGIWERITDFLWSCAFNPTRNW